MHDQENLKASQTHSKDGESHPLEQGNIARSLPPAPFQLSASGVEDKGEEEGPLQLQGGGEGFAALPPPPKNGQGTLQRKIRKSEGLIGEFGDTYRELDINPDKNVESFTRWDDAPIHEDFRFKFNKLENWHIYIKEKAPDSLPHLLSMTDSEGLEFRGRATYVDIAKKATKDYKKGKRDLGNSDISETEDTFNGILEELIERMSGFDTDIRTWYEQEASSGDLEGEKLDSTVSKEGNRLFRESWKDAIYDVNRILKTYWPAVKADLQKWVLKKREEGLHLSGEVGELTYIGSLAKGYKGPPKQHVRFNPDQFDVDASLEAPPIAQFAVEEKGLKTDKGKIFGHLLYEDIPELKAGSERIEKALDDADVVPLDPDDAFEIAFPARDTAGQINQSSASAGLSFLREYLSSEEYDILIQDPVILSAFVITENGTQVGELNDKLYMKVRKKLLDQLSQIPEEEMDKETKNELRDILRQNMVKDFGDEHRDEKVDPEEGVESYTRWDDSPIDDNFREVYNQLENWNIFIQSKFPGLKVELGALEIGDNLTFANRAEFVEEAKKATKVFKKGVRDLGKGNVEGNRTTFDQKIAALLEGMENAETRVQAWFEQKDEADGEDGADLKEKVQTEGTELWRESWKDAMFEVNKILNAHWPALKTELEKWVVEQQEKNGLHLPGEIGELTYIGSLAKGYKGPPKQHVRFNPEKFDVDASLVAPPIARFATEEKDLKTDKGKIFGSLLYDDIPALKAGSEKIDSALDKAGVVPHDPADPFEIAFPAKDTAGQINQYSASAGLSFLRKYISAEDYENFIADPVITSSFVITEDGSQVAEINDAKYAKVRKKILERLDQIPDHIASPEIRAELREVLRQNMLKDFGGEYRKEDLDPNQDIHSFTRWDDAPIKEDFRVEYNKLENWHIFIQTKFNDLADEMADVENEEGDKIPNREQYVTQAKNATKTYKKGIRNLGDTDVSEVKTTFDQTLDGLIARMKGLNKALVEWFETKDEADNLTGAELDSKVEEEGTEIWRENWKDAVYEVNKILNGIWPALKTNLEKWVLQKRADGMFLPGEIGELTYIGSLAKAYKGPPKQHVRFNPEKFDVDASLEAPPIAKFAKDELELKPDKGKIFGKDLYGEIPELKTGSENIDKALDKAGVVPHDPSDPFEIAFPAPETAGQINQYSMSSAMSYIRDAIPAEDYENLVNSRELASALVIDMNGNSTLGEISDAKYEQLRSKILAVAKEKLDDIKFRRISHILRKS